MSMEQEFDIIKEPIRFGTTKYGFDYQGLIRVVRACHGYTGGRPWACIRIVLHDGSIIDIDASKRKHWITEKRGKR